MDFYVKPNNVIWTRRCQFPLRQERSNFPYFLSWNFIRYDTFTQQPIIHHTSYAFFSHSLYFPHHHKTQPFRNPPPWKDTQGPSDNWNIIRAHRATKERTKRPLPILRRASVIANLLVPTVSHIVRAQMIKCENQLGMVKTSEKGQKASLFNIIHMQRQGRWLK